MTAGIIDAAVLVLAILVLIVAFMVVATVIVTFAMAALGWFRPERRKYRRPRR